MAVRAAAAPLVFYPVRMAPSGGSLPPTEERGFAVWLGAPRRRPPRAPHLLRTAFNACKCDGMIERAPPAAVAAGWAASAAANAGTVRKQKGGREEDGKGWQAK